MKWWPGISRSTAGLYTNSAIRTCTAHRRRWQNCARMLRLSLAKLSPAPSAKTAMTASLMCRSLPTIYTTP